MQFGCTVLLDEVWVDSGANSAIRDDLLDNHDDEINHDLNQAKLRTFDGQVIDFLK